MNKIALITGATAGIGRSAAEKFAENNFNLIISGRRSERLNLISEEIKRSCNVDVLPLAFDIRNLDEVKRAIGSLDKNWCNIDILVNNAGLAAGLDSFQDAKIDDWETMIDTNIKGLLYVSKLVIPIMQQRNYGHIINIGSIAGREVYPRGNVYSATKHAVDAITKAMRIDLLGTGIRVSQIAPGAVETEFSMVRFKGDEERAAKVYQGYEALNPKDVAEAIYFVTTLPERVNINDLLIMPTAQANATTFRKQ